MVEKMHSPEQVAEVLGVQPETVRMWLRDGQLKGIKFGRLWRIAENELQRFIDQHRDDE